MNKYVKIACAATLTGAFALAAASPSEARHRGHRGGHSGAAAAIGFGVGALAGAAIANSAHRSYYGGPDYYYDEPGYYAYEPAPVYRYRGRSRGRVINGQSEPSCATDGGYGRVDYSAC